jgi:hypothetical protein
MYHDIMDLYGDKGNMMVLKKRCEDRDIPFEAVTVGIGDEADLRDFDLIFLGGGQDKEQMSLAPDLMARKENIVQAMEAGAFVFLVCGGYQLFGQYYEAADGSKVPGLGIGSYYTKTGDNGSRCIGNVVLDVQLDDLACRAVGFENHGGQTLGIEHPFGKVVKGCGNAFGAGFEGYYDGRMLGTYLHGPLLPKNPQIADFIIAKALAKKNPGFTWKDLSELNDPYSGKAREVIIERCLQ